MSGKTLSNKANQEEWLSDFLNSPNTVHVENISKGFLNKCNPVFIIGHLEDIFRTKKRFGKEKSVDGKKVS